MATKTDLVESLEEVQGMCEAAAEVLTDPDLPDRTARIEAVEQLGFRPPAFLIEDEEDDD